MPRPAEIAALRKIDKITAAEWAEKYRILSAKNSAEPGPWRMARTPYLYEPLEAVSDAAVRKIVLVFGTQTGKTSLIENALGYIKCVDPGPTLMVYPTEAIAKKISKTRFEILFQDTPALAAQLPKCEDDFSALMYDFPDMTIFFGWAGSSATLASHPIRYFLGDEIGKWPKFAGKDANPVALAIERTRTFPKTKKIILTSTPTYEDDGIWPEYMKTDRRKFWIPCPHCGTFQLLVRANLKFDENTPAHLLRRGVTVKYLCPHCEKQITDTEKLAVMQDGVWCPDDATVKAGAVVGGSPSDSRGYWLSSFYSPWVTFGDIAAERVECGKDQSKLMNLVNAIYAEPWVEKNDSITTGQIRGHISDYDEGEVPAGVQVLTAGADVQAEFISYVIVGWGAALASWRIRAGRVSSWNELIEVMSGLYQNRRGDKFRVRMCNVDSGYRTDEVYELIARYPDIFRAIKGASDLKGAPFSTSRIDVNRQTGASYVGGRQLWRLDTGLFKDQLMRLIGEKNWFVYRSAPESYFTEMSGEMKVFERNKKTGKGGYRWKPRTPWSAVHSWDCEVYALAAANMLGVQFIKENTVIIQEAAQPRQAALAEERKPNATRDRWKIGRY